MLAAMAGFVSGLTIWRGVHRLYLILAAGWVLCWLPTVVSGAASTYGYVTEVWQIPLIGYAILHALHWAVMGFRK